MGRADILYYLGEHQRERRRVTGLLYRVLAVVESYADYVAAEDKEAFPNEPFGIMVRADLKEHLATAEPHGPEGGTLRIVTLRYSGGAARKATLRRCLSFYSCTASTMTR